MLKNQVVEYYGGITKTAIALGVTHSAVCQWGSVIPQKQAFVIERITKGKLKYDASLYQKGTDSAA
ncbi:TPA: Cro/Cl family transcriptional regulator [Klebsiella pneumoniae]|uniref:Cro/CI family transcriptional regulator n=1 Tax=Klebsiella TaxID=570 RepID=UPI0009BAAF1D|nr:MULTISPECIES: Cro/CI family transcriptional regulator [Klebsiella]MDW6145685.1 Cro/CI family transcriptional regulator [Escherichia coli]HBQ3187397.1 Cro/Cl family transcriptional regulator [Klebsiella variicola subsp. variicola]HDS4180905.1 Cro/Cl family transcriptional regulator [Klebsiella pneumoniae subsp. pneumoniae]EKV4534366.1 Cro/Cl family transcriptional regulator [Klebsiella pneumoniae]EKZ5442630.1 Cro/Cl family transcriptional regulator [Klebsiella aerogenes]